MLNRKPLLAFALCAVLAIYLLIALNVTASMAREDMFSGCRISITDSLNTGFVTEQELSADCDNLLDWVTKLPRKDISLYDLENRLKESDKIEDANVCVLNNGTLAINVTPMVPVARVFNGDNSYYINAVGKQISADPRYHVDVPVVVGYFDADHSATRLLPMLKYISENPRVDALVSTIKQDQNGDIIMVPTIRGHVVNLGDTSMIANKFDRLREFYRQVMPVRGWETYDTLSVKWRGRVVAAKRDKSLPDTRLFADIEDYDDIDDTETMTSPLHAADAPD